MNIKGDKIKVNKSAEELFDFLMTPAKYEEIMPDNLSKFEVTDYGFKFALKSMPEVGLKIDESTPYSHIKLAAASGSLDFSLEGFIQSETEKTSSLHLDFNGNFNPMIQMMVKSPLEKFVNTLTTNIENLK